MQAIIALELLLLMVLLYLVGWQIMRKLDAIHLTLLKKTP